MSVPRLTLAQQLKQLEGDGPAEQVDPESAYTSLDSTARVREGDEGREHYFDVGPSRIRPPAAVSQTLLSDKYGGKSSSRMKIFDDDDDEEEEEEGVEGANGGDGVDGDEDDYDDEVEEGEDEDGDEDEDEDEDEEGGEEEEEEEEEAEEGYQELPLPSTSKRSLDPVASLRDSRMKDVEKGRAIKRQRTLFESLITLRITYQKSVQASSKLPATLPADSAGEVATKREDVLRSLADLSERLFSIRQGLTLPGMESEEDPVELGKRKRNTDGELSEEYWTDSARDSLDLVDSSHPHLLPILNKWSTKIHAASLQLGSKQSGTSKFLQSTKSQQPANSVVEAIESSLQSKSTNSVPFYEFEETSYRSLLREVIESRTGSGSSSAIDLGHLRKEKKKKREAERGGSKGRRLRYTVHEKAQNFVVPTALVEGWHDEQIDELFASLLGGSGGRIEAELQTERVDEGNNERGLASLGGLRVF